MKKTDDSPRKMKQSKITAFCLRLPGGSPENRQPQANGKKRKFEEVGSRDHVGSMKKMTLHADDAEGPGRFGAKSPEKVVERFGSENQYPNEFDGFSFEDFENCPFLSPKKVKSPKKEGILRENRSQVTDEETWQQESFDLSFETPVRCVVLRFAVVTSGRFEQVLQVKEEKSDKKGICRLRDAWTFSSVSVDDVVGIQTTRSEEGWVVDNKTGYLILHPNLILSSTTLVKGMFCLRRGVLSNFYGGIERGSSGKMLMGRLVHELLQKCLRIDACAEKDFDGIIASFLQASDYLHDLYFSDTSINELLREVESFVPSVRHFLDVYIKKVAKPSGKNFPGTIEEIVDIEELIRSPNLGFQGRVDVTVKIKSNNREKMAPLELKTGKATFSAEHKSQVTLYVMLMNEIGRKVESALLLYLKDGIMEEIVPSRDEVRNLFLLRNRFVVYYKSLRENDLPEPVRSTSCGNCPYQRVCVTHLKKETLYETHPLRQTDFPDIQPSHVDYFMHWNKLLWLEFGKHEDEDGEGGHVSNMKLKPTIEKVRNEFKHEFSMPPGLTKPLQPGTCVFLFGADDKKICTATVMTCTSSECSLVMNQKLDNFSDAYKMRTYKTKFMQVYMSNLGLLMEERHENLRKIIVNKEKPTFQEKLNKKAFREKCLGNLLTLNREQQKAILKSLVCNDYLLIKGPPGTGKTETIVALIRILVALEKKVLLTGHTNSSVDNVLLKLTDVEYLRLGSLRSANSKVHPRCHATLMKECKNLSDVERLFEAKVIASTCLGMDTDFISKMKFDVCVVDESSQVLQCEVLRPFFCSKKFILVGDEDQLSPVVQNQEAKKLGMSESLFERLRNDEATVKLRLQYRMNSRINSLANWITYGGSIDCANEKIANRRIEIRNQGAYEGSHEWIRYVLSPSHDRSITFIDTSNYFPWKGLKAPERVRSSQLEANIVRKLLRHLMSYGLTAGEIGVMTPFGDQIAVLKRSLESDSESAEIELNTVDQYQGRDKEVILFSFGKENQPSGAAASEHEILNDMKRTTVAVTRAKLKLIFIGDKNTVGKYGPIRKVFEGLNESEFLYLKEGEKDFRWNQVDVS